MPAGARRSLASPTVVNGVLCQCGGVSPSRSSPASFSSSGRSEAASRFLAEHERRLYSLFVQLDVNRDGALCVHDLAVGLERLGLHRSERDLWVSLLPPWVDPHVRSNTRVGVLKHSSTRVGQHILVAWPFFFFLHM